MAYIECTGAKAKKYLRICKNRAIAGTRQPKKIVIKNLGPLKRFDDGKPDFLKRFRERFNSDGITVDGVLYRNDDFISKQYNFNIPFTPEKSLDSISFKHYNYGYTILDAVLSSLKVNDYLKVYKFRCKTELDLCGVLRLLVLSRILNPDSKLSTFEAKDDFFGAPFASIHSVKDIYRALDIFSSLSLNIQTRINTSITNSTIGRKVDLIYYDVTNYYFETMYGDEDIFLTVDDVSGDNEGNTEPVYDEDGNPIIVKRAIRKKGVSKENRSEPIVQMGLFIDQNGIPISYDIFPGSMHDQMTFSEMIASHHMPMNLGRVVVVADNGMHNQYNLYDLVANGDGYIISKSLRKSWRSMRDFVLDEEGYTIRHTDENGNPTFKYKSITYTKVLNSRKDEDGKRRQTTLKEKMVVFWSKAHAEADRRENAKFVEYLESCKEHPEKFKDKSKIKRYFKQVQTNKQTGEKVATKDKAIISYELDEAKVKVMQEVYGYYAIVTSETEEDDIDIINRYHNLSRIEDSFRITKSDLEGRPVYVRTEEHIRAHFLICFIALVIIRLIQIKYQKLYGEDLSKDHEIGKHRHWQQGITAERLQEILRDFRVAKDRNDICLFDANDENREVIKRLFHCLGTDFAINEPTTNEIKSMQIRLKKNFKL